MKTDSLNQEQTLIEIKEFLTLILEGDESPEITKTKQALALDLRRAQYVVSENWKQEKVKVDILCWKYEHIIAMQLIDDLCDPDRSIDAVRQTKNFNGKQTPIVKIVINLGQPIIGLLNIFEDVIFLNINGPDNIFINNNSTPHEEEGNPF